MFVDSHCHLDCIDLDAFDGNYDAMIAECLQSGVEHMLCVSIDLDKYPHMRELAQRHPQVSVSAGVHPMADRSAELDIAVLAGLVADESVVAVGETGLDYYYSEGDAGWQQRRFSEHLSIAVEHGKPVIVHTRDAGDDTIAILSEGQVVKCGGVIHCFTETMRFAERAMELGMMISFSGIITFRNADALREVAANVPDDYLLIETDSPYLAPVPHRGRQNYPAYVRHVAEKLAEIRNTSVEHIAEVSRNNFYQLFNVAQD